MPASKSIRSTNGAAAFLSLMAVERIVLVLDASTSMGAEDYPPSRLEAAKEASLRFVDRKLGLDDRDEVAIVAFSANARTFCPLERVGNHRDHLEKAIGKLKVNRGQTAIGEGLREAASILGVDLFSRSIGNQPSQTVSRVILLSDGENNEGPDPSGIAGGLKRAGVVIDTIGIGEAGLGKLEGWKGLDEETLMSVASPGRYRYISDISSLVKHFAGLAEKIAIDRSDIHKVDGGNSGFLKSIGGAIEAVNFSLFWVRKIRGDSLYLGLYCLNERDEETRFRKGDVIVICPKCRRPHHRDCWIWRGGRCYGGEIPCIGKGRVFNTSWVLREA